MKKLLILALFLSGCSPTIECWYAGQGYNPIPGQFPRHQLHGRVSGWMRTDVEGPYFQSLPEMEGYISTQSLKICATTPK